MTDPFTADVTWQRLPAAYLSARRIAAAAVGIPLTVALAGYTAWWWGWWWAAAVAVGGLSWTAWRLVRAGRWVRAFGYAERDADLLVTEGLWFRQLTAIPYGRMLAVNVEAGPLERRFGLASVRLVTASPQSAGRIPGLLQPAAVALRDRLIAAGEQQALPL